MYQDDCQRILLEVDLNIVELNTSSHFCESGHKNSILSSWPKRAINTFFIFVSGWLPANPTGRWPEYCEPQHILPIVIQGTNNSV